MVNILSTVQVSSTRLPLGQQGAVERWDCPAVWLLGSLWHEIASGTARSTILLIKTILSQGTYIKTKYTKDLVSQNTQSSVHHVPWDRLAYIKKVVLLVVPKEVLFHNKDKSITSAGLFLQRDMRDGQPLTLH